MNKCKFCQEPAQDLVLSHSRNGAIFLSLRSKTPILRYVEHKTGGIEADIRAEVKIKEFKFCPVCGKKLGDKNAR